METLENIEFNFIQLEILKKKTLEREKFRFFGQLVEVTVEFPTSILF